MVKRRRPKLNIALLKSLSEAAGVPGREERVREIIRKNARGIFDEHGNMMVLSTHNTDFGDAFEREGENRAYFERFAGVGYAFGINALLYAMTH